MKKTTKPVDSGAFVAKRQARLSKKTVHAIAPSKPPSEPLIDAFGEAEDDLDELTICGSSNGLGPKKRLVRAAELPKFLAPESALEVSCKVMAIALQWRSYRTSTASESSDEEMDSLLDDLEVTLDTSFVGSNKITRLLSLLEQLNRGELSVQLSSNGELDEKAKCTLIHAVHAAVASHCQAIRFAEAVEEAGQRAIYQFAYGLSHEINNPLANIAARAQQLISKTASESDRRSLATIVDQSMRAHEMLSEMMRVVKPRSTSNRVEDIEAIVRQAVEIQGQQWEQANIHCKLRGSAKPLYGYVDKNALLEAICSLLQNAYQVCHANDRIEVVCEELATNHPDYGLQNLLQETEQQPNPSIRIAVRDTGPGMSSEAVKCAWDVYFSGREHGRGLGISLASVRRTIEASQGSIWIQSKPDAGCTVEIRLPISPAPPKRRTAFLL